MTAAETGLRQDEQSHQQWLTRHLTGTLGFSLPVCCSFCLSLRYLFTCIMIGHCRLTQSPAAAQQHGEGSMLACNFTLATYVTSGAVGGGSLGPGQVLRQGIHLLGIQGLLLVPLMLLVKA